MRPSLAWGQRLELDAVHQSAISYESTSPHNLLVFMNLALKRRAQESTSNEELTASEGLLSFVPKEVLPLDNPQRDLPRIAKDVRLVQLIEEAVRRIPTGHVLNRGDARAMSQLDPSSVHLVLTSPPYWTLKEYRSSEGQMGHIEDYESFLTELDKVWAHCFRALVPGGRLVCVVGDVCLSRRKNHRCCAPYQFGYENGRLFSRRYRDRVQRRH